MKCQPLAAISECRCLHVPATKLIRNPSDLNGLLGFAFGAGIDLNNINDLARRFKSPPQPHPSYSERNITDRRKALLASRHRYSIAFGSGKSSTSTVLLFAMFESKTRQRVYFSSSSSAACSGSIWARSTVLMTTVVVLEVRCVRRPAALIQS